MMPIFCGRRVPQSTPLCAAGTSKVYRGGGGKGAEGGAGRPDRRVMTAGGISGGLEIHTRSARLWEVGGKENHALVLLLLLWGDSGGVVSPPFIPPPASAS